MTHRPLNCLVACVAAATLALASPALARGGGGGGGGQAVAAGAVVTAGAASAAECMAASAAAACTAAAGFGGMHAMGGGCVLPASARDRALPAPGFAGRGFSPRFSHAAFAHGFVHNRFFFHNRFHRFAFFGAPFAYADYGYYDGCWRRYGQPMDRNGPTSAGATAIISRRCDDGRRRQFRRTAPVAVITLICEPGCRSSE